jgi:spermine oxidase
VTNADLRGPLTNSNGDMKIIFAGEATNEIHYASVHGAVETGWAAADMIINSQ